MNNNNAKTTTFSVKKGYTYKTALKEKHLVCRQDTHIHNNTKTTTFSIKKGDTWTTALKQQHLV